ncbi:MAG: HAMP domain-containing sensor histidine kinase, partial [Pseudomonadota bacterium]
MFRARTLSGRLLILTILSVMVIEVVIFLPSVARYRVDYLTQRLQMAQIASLALLAAEDEMVEAALERELLVNAEVSSIVVRRDFARQLVLQSDMSGPVEETFDLRDVDILTMIYDALRAFWRAEDRMIRVIGLPPHNPGQAIEITMAERPLCEAMFAFAQRVLILSILISGGTGLLIFLICRRLIVRPMERVVENMVAFQKDPERGPTAIEGGSGLIEIARAERALAEMQGTVQSALRQKSRLAELGAAVAKISHDLRNMLASAQLMADRLDGSTDPVVSRIGPKIIRSLDRAATLCVSTLKHGKAEEAPPEARRVLLHGLVEDVRDAVFADGGDVAFANETPAELEATADGDHLFRVLANLCRNARQAIETTNRPGRVTIRGGRGDDGVWLEIADDGPGMPAK